jgi:nitrate reductase assembly molybdenum cofactor insertion protein NarJ
MTTDSHGLTERARELTLASLLSSYPDDDFAATLGELGAPLANHEGASGVVAALALPEGVDDVRSAYLGLFDSGKDRASLYETEYGRMRGMAKGNDLADIAGFYNAFGVTVAADEVHELPDHIAVELEFYAMLLLKQQALADIGDAEGLEIVTDARKKFLVDHLGRVAGAVAARKDVREDPVYGPVFTWCWKLVERECASLGVKPAPLDFFSDKELKEEMKCGAVHLPVLQ